MNQFDQACPTTITKWYEWLARWALEGLDVTHLLQDMLTYK